MVRCNRYNLYSIIIKKDILYKFTKLHRGFKFYATACTRVCRIAFITTSGTQLIVGTAATEYRIRIKSHSAIITHTKTLEMPAYVGDIP